jgi:hypothetical protein
MNITKEQLQTAEQGTPVEIQSEGREFVLVRKDVFEKLSEAKADAFDPRETYPAVLKAWDAAGSEADESAYENMP